MAENKVLRVNSRLECNQPIGQLHLKLKDSPSGRDFETVSFYCNLPWNHREACQFRGRDVTVIRTPS